MPAVALFLITGLVCAGLVTGCGSSGGGPTEPDGIALTLGAGAVQVAQTVSVQALLTYPKRVDGYDWYVDGVLGGNSMLGTITQTNPATYTAPPAVPAAGEVVISAVSQSDSTMTASDTLAVLFTIKHVDVSVGSNTSGGGAWNNPLKTVTYALSEIASDGDTVLVHAGVYDQAAGEGTSFYIPEGVTLRGVDADSCVLDVEGNVTPANGATFESFTMTVPERVIPSHGIYTSSTCTIRDIHTSFPYQYSAIRAFEDATPLIENCEIINASGTVSDRGMELVYGTHAIVRNCTISGWSYGIFANEDSDPLVEGCWFHGNSIGFMNYGGTPATTDPDLGGGARGSLGLNTIQDNDCGVHNRTAMTIWALYNTWDNVPPVEGPPYPCDIENAGGGVVLTQAP
jgi:hypothetical protein